MGGRGSGQYAGNSTENMRGGRPKKAAVGVCGTGVPVMPDLLPGAVRVEWCRLEELTRGIAFEQDSDALTELAWLTYRMDQMRHEMALRPLDTELSKQSLAIGRAIRDLWALFGMTPRARQMLLIPKDEKPELDPLEQLQADLD